MLTMFRKRVESEVAAQREAEILQQFASEREEIASGRLEKIKELAATETGLKAELDKAQAAFERGEAEREAAANQQRKSVRDAEYALRGAVFPRQREIDGMTNRLQSELCPESITTALDELTDLYEQNRVFVDGDDPKAKSTLSAWIKTARQQLLDLQLQPSDDISAEVARIMATQPK